ncbi:hypothetical protein ACM7TS_06270, partial [Enterobacter hormaechei]
DRQNKGGHAGPPESQRFTETSPDYQACRWWSNFALARFGEVKLSPGIQNPSWSSKSALPRLGVLKS